MTVHLTKIISGGQTGADTGGLLAGKTLRDSGFSIETGGTAPWNWMTEDGNKKEYLQEFGLKQGPYDANIYPRRTKLNVQNSDGTLLMGRMTERGSELTVSLCKELKKPYIVNPENPDVLYTWLDENSISVLNVAGNRASNNPKIEWVTETLILGAIM